MNQSGNKPGEEKKLNVFFQKFFTIRSKTFSKFPFSLLVKFEKQQLQKMKNKLLSNFNILI